MIKLSHADNRRQNHTKVLFTLVIGEGHLSTCKMKQFTGFFLYAIFFIVK